MITATQIARKVEDTIAWCRARRWRVLLGVLLLLLIRNWLWSDDSADAVAAAKQNQPPVAKRVPKPTVPLGGGQSETKAQPTQDGAPIQDDHGNDLDRNDPPHQDPRFLDLKKSMAKQGDLAKFFAIRSAHADPQKKLSPEMDLLLDEGRALIAKSYNQRLETIALNELPYTSEIIEIRKPIWGYFEENVLVAISTITYRTDKGKTLVALAHFSAGKWTIETGDEYNVLPTVEQNADAPMLLFDLEVERKLNVPD